MRFMRTVVGLICGSGTALGLFFGGMAMWPPEGEEGSCQITSTAGVTYECVGTRGKKFKLNMANVTFSDGSTRQCNSFWLTDKCQTFGFMGSDKPTAVLGGEARPCLWFKEETGNPVSSFSAPAGACVEPGHMDTGKFWGIVTWILAASSFCCCFCGCLYADAKRFEKDAGSHDATGGNKDASAQAATTTDNSRV